MEKRRMKNRTAAALLAVIFALQGLFLAPFPASALDSNARTIFLNQQSGNDSNDGASAEKALKTLDGAINALASEGGVIVITARYTVSSDYKEPDHAGAITLTSLYGGVDYRTSGACLYFANKITYRMSGEDIFKDIDISYGGACVLAACFNPVTFDTGITMANYESASSQFYLLGGYEAPGPNLPDNLDSYITIKSGDFFRVAGFDRTRATGGTYYHSGTSYIDVSGGSIDILFGANLYNHWARNTVLTVSGGKINKICTGGDVTRRIETAALYLYGGSIGQVDINNVTGDAHLYLYGAEISGTVAVRYQDHVAGYAEEEGGKKYISYNGLIYTASQITSFTKTFDFSENVSVLYVSDGGAGNGFSRENPMGSFEQAMSALSENGGCLTVVDKVSVPASFTEKAHSAKITISGAGSEAMLAFAADSVYTASGETSFDGVTLSHGGRLTFKAQDKLTFTRTFHTGGSGVSVEGKEIYLYSGVFDSVTGAFVTVNGAEIARLYCTDGRDIENADVEIASGKVDSLITARNGKITGSFLLRMGGGTLSSLALDNLFGGIILNFGAGSVGALSTSGCGTTGESRILYHASAFPGSMFSSVASLFDEIRGNEAVYVADKGAGNGKSPASPLGSLTDAVKALPQGGTVVICGPVTNAGVSSLPLHSGPIIITSAFAGTDFRSSGAALVMNASLVCGGDTVFEHINIATGNSDAAFYGRGYALTMGEGIESSLVNANTSYPDICAGDRGTGWITDANLTIESGIWSRIRAGTSYSAALGGCEYSVTINGGTFYGHVSASGLGHITGNTGLTINGGTFYQSIYAFYATSYGSFNGKAVITLNGGVFYGKIAASNLKSNALNGSLDLYISGGDFSHVTDIIGAEGFVGSMTSAFYSGENVDINAPEKGTYSFTNYLRVGADPWMFRDGNSYYLTVTGGTVVNLRKGANIGDLAYAEGVTIFAPGPGKPYSLNLWSPEIHYFPASALGEEHEGWYMYFCANSGTSETRRMYVLKCLTDDLQGEWGHPVTGEVNVPQFILAHEDEEINAFMGGGMSPFIYQGTLYTTWFADEGRGTPDYAQIMFINKFENPWTLAGKRVEIARPEYEWEIHGYGQESTTGGWYPKVIEGASSVLDNDGNLYAIYTGSGYWTVWYALGQMRFLGGELCDADNWVKVSETPIFSKSSEINGCGHGSYFTDLEGQSWIAYHAYTGTTTASGRFVFVEPYVMTENGMVIGNGSGQPAPIDTVYTLNVNSTSINEKISGFALVNGAAEEKPDETAPAETTDEGAELPGGKNPSYLTVILISAGVIIAIICVIIIITVKKRKH